MVSAPVRAWLRDALLTGTASDVRFVVRGNLYDFLGNAELAKASFESSLKAFEALGAESVRVTVHPRGER